MENNPNESKNSTWWRPSLILFGKLSSWIVAPIIVGMIFGKYLDKRFDSEPIMLIMVVGFSFLISMYGLIKETMKEYRKIEKDLENKKNSKK